MISFFLGANTPRGFVSLYDELIPREQARGVYLLKGGPGCGKSTLLRQVGRAAEGAGLRPEYILCSGDPDSLDGVVLRERGIALADATAPHVLEPVLPGAVDHYLDLGVCYDTEGLAPLRGELERIKTDYRACYDRAYRCLAAAADIEADCRALLEPGLDRTRLARRVKGILSREFKKGGPQAGQVTRRFLSAVCCKGLLCLWETVEALCPRVYVLEDGFGLARHFLSALLPPALAAGADCILCLSPTDPEAPEHLLFPGLGLGFVTSSPALPYPGKAYRRVHPDTMIDSDLLRSSRARLRFSRKVANALTGEAVESLRQAKGLHDDLEALYHPHVDFARGHTMGEALIRQWGLNQKRVL